MLLQRILIPLSNYTRYSISTTKDGRASLETTEYFTEGFWRSSNPRRIRGMLGAHNRMLSTYINTIVEIGFEIVRMCEPRPSEAVTSNVPGYGIIAVLHDL
jgi:hypothetical protein